MPDIKIIQQLIEGGPTRQISIRMTEALIDLSMSEAKKDGFDNFQSLVKHLLLNYLDSKARLTAIDQYQEKLLKEHPELKK